MAAGSTLLALTAAVLTVSITHACTNVLVTPGASVTGDAFIAYNADSGDLMGMLYHYPAQSFNGTRTSSPIMRKVYNWDTGAYLGEIPEANQTFNVVGNTNEKGLTIAETTFGGISILSDPAHQPHAKIDYGSLIYIALQRSATAREAIRTMVSLMDQYGYASEGESFSLADASTGEVWIMEVIGRGEGKTGSVWVARRVPDGYVAAHSNQARITTFPRDDPENCMYAHDVIDLAKEIGVYKSAADDPMDLKFSFSDVYDPINFYGARWSDARTWSIFSMILNRDRDANAADETSFEKTYEDYARGKDLSRRMPLWIKPDEDQKLTIDDIRKIMANHYEETALSFDQDIGAGQFNAPVRVHPLKWSYGENGSSDTYVNERPVATQQTGWNFISQIRLDMPLPIASILWFAVDDSSTSPRYPVYGCSKNVSAAYGGKGTQDGVASAVLDFDLGKAFWVQNMVSNLCYTRWRDAYPLIKEKIQTIHDSFVDEVGYLDDQLMALHDNGDVEVMVDLATTFSVSAGDRLHKEWMEFYGRLFARLRDLYVFQEDKDNLACKCKVAEGGYTAPWKERIVDETGDQYKCEGGGCGSSIPDKLRLVSGLRGSVDEASSLPNLFASRDKSELKAMK